MVPPLSPREKLFGHFLRFGMVGDEYNFNLFILFAEEAGHPEEKAACAVFFK